jgi:membrane dipeptidase
MVQEISRRKAIGVTLAAATAAPFINTNAYALGPAGKVYSKRAVDLVRQSLVIDMLAPLAIEMEPSFYAAPLSEQAAKDFLASGITGFHNAVGIGGPTARDQALTFFAIWNNFVARNTHVFVTVDKVADLVRAKTTGKCAVIMGLQNADHFLRPDDVKFFYELGQRCAQLTYNSQNRIGSGSTERVDGGITDFGVGIIQAMNTAGMLIDVSHSGPRTTLDAIELSPEPIAITHSNCRALLDHPRLKTDEAIKALARKGGVMGITGVRNFLTKVEPTTIAAVVDHIDHVRNLVGIEHVGIGTDSDLWGYDDTSPKMQAQLRAAYKDSYAFREKIDTDGFDHPLKMFDLTEELIRRRYSDANITAVLGGNFQRLLTATWGG